MSPKVKSAEKVRTNSKTVTRVVGAALRSISALPAMPVAKDR